MNPVGDPQAADSDEIDVRVQALEARNRELAAILEQLASPGQGRVSTRNWDATAAVIAAFVGLLALAVSAYTAHLQRRQLQATVWPRIDLGNSNLDPKLYLSSRGLGPALVKAVRVAVDGKPMRTWDGVVRGFGYGDRAGIHFSSVSNRVFTADKDLLEIAWPRDDGSRSMFLDVIDSRSHQFSMTVCYCSVMNECYVARYGASPAGERGRTDRGEEACPVSDAEQFEN